MHVVMNNFYMNLFIRLEDNIYQACKHLRDHSYPFNIAGENFRVRFSPETVRELCLEFTSLMTNSVKITKISNLFRFLSAFHRGRYQKSDRNERVIKIGKQRTLYLNEIR